MSKIISDTIQGRSKDPNVNAGLTVAGVTTATGVINASSDVRITGNLNAGIVTVTSISGNGSGLSNVGVDTATVDASTLQVSGISTFKNELKVTAGGIEVDGGGLDIVGVSTFASDVRVTGNLNAGITTTSSIINGTALSHRNKIINGAMQIAQRNTSSTSNGIQTVDRWDTTASGMDQLAFTQKQVTDSPDGFSNSYEIDITTAESAQAGDEYMRIQQKIEARDLQYLSYGTSSAKNVTVSFWVKAYQTGDYVVNFYSQDGNRQITRTYTVNASATWEYKSVTIPGDTSGTINNDKGAGLHLAFIVIADSGYRTTDSTSWINYTDGGYGYGQTVNLGSSTDNYWKITGVQLEAGPVATPFEHRSFGDELYRCQRYLIFELKYLCWSGMTTDTYTYYTQILWPTTMRSTPTTTVTRVSEVGFPNPGNTTMGDLNTTGGGLGQTANATNSGGYYYRTITADAEI